MTEEGKPLETYTCSKCGFETNDEKAHCPHDNIIVSTGEPYSPPKVVAICEHCKQPISEKGENVKASGGEQQKVPDPDKEKDRRESLKSPVFKPEDKDDNPKE